MRKILLNPHFVASQSHFCGSSIHLKVPTATVATSKICSMVSPMNSPSEVGPKWVCPRIRPKIQWWKTVCFPIKIAMFRYTPISGKTPHQQLVGYISNRIPIISDTMSHVIFNPNSSISPKSYRYKTPIKDPQKISPQQKSIRYFHHIGFVQKKCIKPPTMKLYDDDTYDIH